MKASTHTRGAAWRDYRFATVVEGGCDDMCVLHAVSTSGPGRLKASLQCPALVSSALAIGIYSQKKTYKLRSCVPDNKGGSACQSGRHRCSNGLCSHCAHTLQG